MQHQFVGTRIASLLDVWSEQTQLGRPVNTPGVILTNTNAVVPDVAWISNERCIASLYPDGKIHVCPELVVEILSPEPENRKRGQQTKLKLYSHYGAEEYWV
jgi:Uma2 family endonuclease